MKRISSDWGVAGFDDAQSGKFIRITVTYDHDCVWEIYNRCDVDYDEETDGIQIINKAEPLARGHFDPACEFEDEEPEPEEEQRVWNKHLTEVLETAKDINNLEVVYEKFNHMNCFYSQGVKVGDVVYNRIDLDYELEEAIALFRDEDCSVVVSLYSEDNDSANDLYFDVFELMKAETIDNKTKIQADSGEIIVIEFCLIE